MSTARVFTLQVIPSKIDEFIQVWHNAMLPNAQAQNGWENARLLVDRESSKVVIIGLWTTLADALASSTGSQYAERQRALLATMVTAPPIIEHFEVAGDA